MASTKGGTRLLRMDTKGRVRTPAVDTARPVRFLEAVEEKEAACSVPLAEELPGGARLRIAVAGQISLTAVWTSTTSESKSPSDQRRWAKRIGCSSAKPEPNNGGAVPCMIVESCRRRRLDLHAYLKDVLTRLPSMTNHQLRDILPANWTKSRQNRQNLAA